MFQGLHGEGELRGHSARGVRGRHHVGRLVHQLADQKAAGDHPRQAVELEALRSSGRAVEDSVFPHLEIYEMPMV